MTCLRCGYQCNCADCQIWIRRWERERSGWELVDSMIKDGRSLYSIYDRLHCEYPDMLNSYRKIEDKFIERSIERVDLLSEDGEITDDEPGKKF